MNSSALVVNKMDYGRLAELLGSTYIGTRDRPYLQTLKDELAASRRTPPARVPKGVVTMRSRVRVRDLDSDEVETFTLVYPEEADLDEGKLSVLSPLGSAVFGARVGDVVSRRLPGGILSVKVEAILYQPEAAGDHDL
ncbi:MAG: GreA/GreB family elongation factor [Bacillota bacterium]